MIRPGKMRQTITLQRVALALNAYGTEVETWSNLATLRAELVEIGAADAASATPGTKGLKPVTFRTRLFGGVTVADRVIWKGAVYAIKAVSGGDFAEGRGLELQCEGAA